MFTDMNGQRSNLSNGPPNRRSLEQSEGQTPNSDRLRGGSGMGDHGLFPAGMSIGFVLACFLVGYIYISLALQTISEKTNTANGWLAWIPIANIILMLNIAKKPLWWIILFLIPLVNIVMAILVWMGVAEARSKPSWWGILIIIPFVNLIVPGYLAWSD
jgi:hypothetical protein